KSLRRREGSPRPSPPRSTGGGGGRKSCRSPSRELSWLRPFLPGVSHGGVARTERAARVHSAVQDDLDRTRPVLRFHLGFGTSVAPPCHHRQARGRLLHRRSRQRQRHVRQWSTHRTAREFAIGGPSQLPGF